MNATKPLDAACCAMLVGSPRWQRRLRAESTGCTVWTGCILNTGYGQVWLSDGRMALAHRVALVAHLGRDLSPGLVVDHLCRNRSCVNPRHLDEVTERENIGRGVGPTARGIRTGMCPAGHPRVPGKDCTACCRQRKLARTVVLREARNLVGLDRRGYLDRYGWSVRVAEAIIAESRTDRVTPDQRAALRRIAGKS